MTQTERRERRTKIKKKNLNTGYRKNRAKLLDSIFCSLFVGNGQAFILILALIAIKIQILDIKRKNVLMRGKGNKAGTNHGIDTHTHKHKSETER